MPMTAYGIDLKSGDNPLPVYRNLRVPRTSETRAELANPIHHEVAVRRSKWRERLMLMAAGSLLTLAVILLQT
jgi:type II secretory pathway component PulM